MIHFLYSAESLKKVLLGALIFGLLIFTAACSGKDFLYIGFFPGEGIKGYNGSSWKNISQGLPKDFEAEYIISDSAGTLYLTTEYSGIFKRSVSDSEWIDISSPLFKRRTQLDGVDEYRSISAFTIDPNDRSKLYLATKHVLYKSSDSGKSWSKINVLNNKNSYYFTSLAVVGDVIYAGTSFNGIVSIAKDSTKEINEGIPKEYYVGIFHFCEEVSSIAHINNRLYTGYLFGRGMRETADQKRWGVLDIPIKNEKTEGVYGIAPFNDTIFVSTTETVYEYNMSDKKFEESKLQKRVEKSYSDKAPAMLFVNAGETNPSLFIKRNVAEYTMEETSKWGDKQALYVSWGMIETNFKRFMEILLRNKFNAVVIDVKDDFGIINAPIESKTASELGVIKNTNIKDIIKQLHDHGIYVIARNVTFKDKKLYEAYNNKYAIWDKATNRAWVGLPREKWCDPYSKFIRDYNIEIAKETAKLGFDEIQFDYIRFPTDGQIGNCKYRYRENDDTFKSEIMGDFLQQASREVDIPISIDIYGYNAWYRFGNLIAQDIQFLSRFVHAIYPMVYPSHFGVSFYSRYPAAEKPYMIVRDSSIRSIYHSRKRTVIRQWIQGWNYLSPTWGPDYILKQVKGVIDGGGRSYSFWNPRGDHSMADRAFNG
ncbi:MAG: hypothetical protein FWG49_00725, partial [Leptospirales bacterium]|nr:hypothetical protein [Leptospirales bacterium]